MSKHFDISDWLDFLRGFRSPDQQSAMELHRSFCLQCQETVDWIERLQQTSTSGSLSDVPNQVIHNAQAIFALRQFNRVQIRSSLRSPFSPTVLAFMAFDSFQQPAVAGVRSEQRTDVRHMLYESDQYTIDLRLEHERSLPAVTMTGQIHANQSHPKCELDFVISSIPVTLTSNRIVLAFTTCNKFGEFAMEYLPQSELCLHLGPVDFTGQDA